MAKNAERKPENHGCKTVVWGFATTNKGGLLRKARNRLQLPFPRNPRSKNTRGARVASAIKRYASLLHSLSVCNQPFSLQRSVGQRNHCIKNKCYFRDNQRPEKSHRSSPLPQSSFSILYRLEKSRKTLDPKVLVRKTAAKSITSLYNSTHQRGAPRASSFVPSKLRKDKYGRCTSTTLRRVVYASIASTTERENLPKRNPSFAPASPRSSTPRLLRLEELRRASKAFGARIVNRSGRT